MLNLRTIDGTLGSLDAPVCTRCQVTSSAMEDEYTMVTQEGNTSAVAAAATTVNPVSAVSPLLALTFLSPAAPGRRHNAMTQRSRVAVITRDYKRGTTSSNRG